MGKTLVIVESPAKAKTINKYLGKDFIVKSSVGHVRDLPSSGGETTDASERTRKAAETRKLSADDKAAQKKVRAREALVARMGVDPEHGWAARYEVLPDKIKVVEELRKLARQADEIYLATDLDREGEAIAWHLREVIGGDESRFKRVVFNEITKSAIQEAFKQPGRVNMNRVNAQQARRFLDRVVGYMVSPLLWAKIARGLSAGRVQSVAVKLLVEREREIRAFLPEEYWDLFADTTTAKRQALRLQVARDGGQAFRPVNETQAMSAVARLKDETYRVSGREDKPTRSRAAPPFTTSTLQQAASTRLGFSVKRTMNLAQRLYEAGFITYMRTDSTNLSQDAINAVRGYIKARHGERYLPEKPNFYASKEGAQEAHEAIRPTDVKFSADQITGLDRDAQKLYDLIWKRFVACQMPPAEYLSTQMTVTAGDFELRAKGRVLKFDGHLVVNMPGQGGADEDIELPDVAVGDVLALKKLDPSRHFTKPPQRYSEAALVRELEKRGIGRPSTYAAIISTIQDRGYVRLESRRFYAEKMGEIVTARLDENFDNLMDFSFTARMEEKLDHIAQGDLPWVSVLDDFYRHFSQQLKDAERDDGGMRSNQPVATGIACPQCGRPMMIRTGSTGVFLGCSGYSLPPKERCKGTLNLVPGNEAVRHGNEEDETDEAEAIALSRKRRCAKCGTAMESYLIDATRKLHVCGNNPDCDGHEIEAGAFKIKGYDGPIVECDKCGQDMQLKTGRFGKYFGCTNPACGNTRKLMKNGEVAPPKEEPIPMPHLRCVKSDDFYLLRDGASGLFLAASQFPKHRETRAPSIAELKTVAGLIPEKYRFLLDAPQTDPEGNPVFVRFSRKSREQYVMSEKDGKPTAWMAYYKNGVWSARKEEGESKPATKGKAATTKKAAPKARAVRAAKPRSSKTAK